jgi:prepilin-type N-terminal cleavage/methylation domain-containing protein
VIENRPRDCAHGAAAAGFTIIEVMVVVLIIGLIVAMIAPNLRAFVPAARIEASAKVIVANVDHMRSEARIQGKCLKLEFDLDHAMWRRVFPPEERLTTDQDVDPLEPKYEDWNALEEDVQIANAGNPLEGRATKGVFPLVFDADGCTGDQSIVLRLKSDQTMMWTINIRGLTGRCEIVPDYEGHEHIPEDVGEGSF